jgi:hypothetical protein
MAWPSCSKQAQIWISPTLSATGQKPTLLVHPLNTGRFRHAGDTQFTWHPMPPALTPDIGVFDRNALDLSQIRDQPIQCPRAERQAEFAWRCQRRLNHHADILGRVHWGRPSRGPSSNPAIPSRLKRPIHQQAVRSWIPSCSAISCTR